MVRSKQRTNEKDFMETDLQTIPCTKQNVTENKVVTQQKIYVQVPKN